MQKAPRFAVGLVFLVSAAVVTACSSTTASPSPSASPTASASASAGNPVIAPASIPDATPTPTPTATATPTPTPTAAPILPDLSVQGMTITQDSPIHARVTFDIHNIGTADVTQPFYVYVCITTLCVEKQITQPVAAAGLLNAFVDFNHPSSTTPETVAVAVDSRNDIKELREDNNTTSLADVSLNF